MIMRILICVLKHREIFAYTVIICNIIVKYARHIFGNNRGISDHVGKRSEAESLLPLRRYFEGQMIKAADFQK